MPLKADSGIRSVRAEVTQTACGDNLFSLGSGWTYISLLEDELSE
jgi:hypothetical protein